MLAIWLPGEQRLCEHIKKFHPDAKVCNICNILLSGSDALSAHNNQEHIQHPEEQQNQVLDDYVIVKEEYSIERPLEELNTTDIDLYQDLRVVLSDCRIDGLLEHYTKKAEQLESFFTTAQEDVDSEESDGSLYEPSEFSSDQSDDEHDENDKDDLGSSGESFEDDYIRKHAQYICQFCDHESPKFFHFKQHALLVHNNSMPFVVCCGKQYPERNLLFRHVQAVNDGSIRRSFKCTRCSKILQTQHQLNVHIRRHKLQMYDCTHCQETFADVTSFGTHIRMCWSETSECELVLPSKVALEAQNAQEHSDNQTIPHEQQISDKEVSVDEQPAVTSAKSDTETAQLGRSTVVSDGGNPAGQVGSNRDKLKHMVHDMADTLIARHIKFECKQCGHRSQTFRQFLHHSRRMHNCGTPFIVCCGKKYYKRHALMQHVQYVKNPDVFKCKSCNIRYPLRKGLVEHFKIVHLSGRAKFKCHCCPETFASKKLQFSHMRTHKNCECQYCGKLFPNASSYSVHKRIKHPTVVEDSSVPKLSENTSNITSFSEAELLVSEITKREPPEHDDLIEELPACSSSNLKVETLQLTASTDEHSAYKPVEQVDNERETGEFHDDQDTSDNAMIVKREREFTCQICGHRLPDTKSLRAHERLMHPNAFVCYTCNQLLPSLDALQVHKIQKHKMKQRAKDTPSDKHTNSLMEDNYIKKHVKFICKECGLESQSFYEFRAHAEHIHRRKNPYLECCGKKYSFRCRLYQHVQLVTNPEVFKCWVCGKKCADKGGLLGHIDRVHVSNHRRFKCDLCPKSFNYKRIYRSHLRNHSKSLQCRHCGQYFLKGTKLSEHISSMHPQLKKFNCDVCSKKFCIEWRFQRHKMKHTAQKCQLCPEVLPDRGSLCVHARSAHPDALVCAICKHVLPSRAALRAHKEQEHGTKHQIQIKEENYSEEEEGLPLEGVDYADIESHQELRVTLTDCMVDGLPQYNSMTPIIKKEPLDVKVEYDTKEDSSEEEFELMDFQNDLEPSDDEQIHQDVPKKRAKLEDVLPSVVLEDENIRKHVQYTCVQCGQESTSFDNFKEHALLAHGDKSPSVECCGENYFLRSSLLQHVQSLNDPATYRCQECREEFKSVAEMRRHIVTVHSTDVIEQIHPEENVPHGTFDADEELLEPIEGKDESVESDDGQESNQSDMDYTPNKRKNLPRQAGSTQIRKKQEDDIKQHVRYICDKCGHESHNFTAFVRHARAVHDIEEPAVTCCGTDYKKRFLLYQHVQIVQNPNTFRCEKCKKRFTKKSTYNKHMKHIHAKDRYNFKCDLCPQVLANKYYLKLHIANHEGRADQSWRCQHCEKWHPSRRSLHKHIRAKHPDAPSVRCDECPMEFLIVKVLMQHKLRHKKLQCPFCPELFVTDKSLRSHALELHPKVEPPQICDRCRTVLPSRAAYHDHMIREHKPRVSEDDDGRDDNVLEGSKEKTNLERYQNQLVSQIVKPEPKVSGNKSMEETQPSCSYNTPSVTKEQRVSSPIVIEDDDSEGSSVEIVEETYAKNVSVLPSAIQTASKKENSDAGKPKPQEKDTKDHKEILDQNCKCEICWATFDTGERLDYHLTHWHGKTPQFACNICSEKFHVKSRLDQHKRKHENIPQQKLKCTLCPEFYTDKKLHELHMQDHEGWELNQWMERFDDPPDFFCEECSKAFRVEKFFQQHKLKHEEAKVQCHKCSETFEDAKSMRAHVRKVHLQTKTLCKTCNLEFPNSEALQKHNVKKHGVTQLIQPSTTNNLLMEFLDL